MLWVTGWGFVPEWPIEGFDGFGIEVFDSLFVASAYTVVGTGVAVEGIDCFSNTHLGGGHGYCWHQHIFVKDVPVRKVINLVTNLDIPLLLSAVCLLQTPWYGIAYVRLLATGLQYHIFALYRGDRYAPLFHLIVSIVCLLDMPCIHGVSPHLPKSAYHCRPQLKDSYQSSSSPGSLPG